MQSPLAEKRDVIIKCPLEEMVKCFFKDYVIVWHDHNINLQENQQYLTPVERFCSIQTFTDWEKASNYIKNTKRICHVITSGTDGEILTKKIYSNDNVLSIYIFCMQRDYHSTWAQNYQKVSCVETEIENIFKKVEENLLKWYKQESSRKLNLPAFAPIFNDIQMNKMNFLHRYLKVIPNFQNREQAKSDFLALSRGLSTDKRNAQLIEEFEQNYKEYNMEKILRWYTRESFLYKVTNNCLRIATSDSIQYCRLPLKDMEKAIREQYKIKSKNFNGLLYRAASLDEQEWQILKANIGQEIEMHGFLSVSKEQNQALKFMGLDSSKNAFITIIIPKGPNDEEQGFAEVEEFSRYPHEKEILFNARSRFTVLEAEEKRSEELAFRHLVLLYGAQGFRRFLAEKNPVQEVSISNLIFCAQCKVPNSEMCGDILFAPITNSESANCYRRACLPNSLESNKTPLVCIPKNKGLNQIKIKGFLLTRVDPQIPFYGYQCTTCRTKREKLYFICTDCHEINKRWCESCFGNTLDCFQQNHIIILEESPFSFWSQQISKKELDSLKEIQKSPVFESELFQQAEMYFENQEYEKSIELYKVCIDENEAHTIKEGLVHCYGNLEQAYHSLGDYKKALEYCLKVENTKSFFAVAKQSDAAILESHQGLVSRNQGKYGEALQHYLKSLEIHKSVHGENHHLVATAYSNIASVFYNQEQLLKALEYYFKALNIRKSIYGDDHAHVAASYRNIADVYHSQREYKKAFDYKLKSLEITGATYRDNSPLLAVFYNNIGLAYKNQGEYQKVLEYHLKALAIAHSTNGNIHLDVAASYNNLGVIYCKQGEYQKALECHLEALSILEKIYEQNHPHFATCYNNIALVYKNQGD